MGFEKHQEDLSDLSGFKYAWYKEGHYTITTKSYLTLGKGKANETEIEEDWCINPLEYGHLTINSSTPKYIKVDGQMKPFYEILEKVNKATDVLKFFLSADKSIEKVENKEEILNKWQEIKKDLRFYELVRNSYNEFISAYDKEFTQIDNNIIHNLLYQIVFYPLPVFDQGDINSKMPDRTVLSTLFPGQKIDYSSEYEISKVSGKGYKVLLRGKGKNNIPEFNRIYEKNYQTTLKIPMDYDYHLEGEYIYNEDSVVSEIMFHVKEQLNTEMLYVCRYHIKLNNH
ncbi:hypothetical protein [Chryseobacterium sp.]|uniref:hypothetical protein n=1 Tax=Chryseobacterium sp. TaxID=1871047 RepID=UPI0025C2307E|nr:hypothetical protein [Chryseobacterium sp.]